MNFYKQPVKYNRGSDILSDNPSDTATQPIRNLVSSSGPMTKKGDRSVGFSGDGEKADKGGKNTPKVMEKEPAAVVDLENVQFNDKASDIRYAREKIFGRIQKSPDDASQKSKKKKKVNALGKTLSVGR